MCIISLIFCNFLGALDSSITPSGNSLRILKSRVTAGSRRHEDTLTSLTLMKQEDDFKNIMHDIGCDPFYLHYHGADKSFAKRLPNN